MSQAVIRFDQVSKTYLLKDNKTTVHALDAVSVEVLAGEALGIVGSNGSGKSTFLKLIAQITAPSKGRLTINGQVASLLEVGLGFHPELSGRDNALFNGALLGVPGREVRRRMDQIIQIADIGSYIDQPLRMYSTGMQARLGFAVACMLQAEIMLLDEVLEVGDASFRKKALELIHTLTREQGRTAIICSHSGDLLREHCDRILWLMDGRVCQLGPAEAVMKNYLQYEYWGRFQDPPVINRELT